MAAHRCYRCFDHCCGGHPQSDGSYNNRWLACAGGRVRGNSADGDLLNLSVVQAASPRILTTRLLTALSAVGKATEERFLRFSASLATPSRESGNLRACCDYLDFRIFPQFLDYGQDDLGRRRPGFGRDLTRFLLVYRSHKTQPGQSRTNWPALHARQGRCLSILSILCHASRWLGRWGFGAYPRRRSLWGMDCRLHVQSCPLDRQTASSAQGR